MANTVGSYKDGVGNLAHAIQWDGDTVGTWVNIQAWTQRASINRRGVLQIQDGPLSRNVGVGDWMVMDNSKGPQVMPMTNGQFTATYVVAP